MSNLSTPTASAEIQERVQGIFVQLFEVDKTDLKPEVNLYQDLGLDSIDAIDLVVCFEREFKMRPSNEEMRAIRTLKDIYALVAAYQEHSSQVQ